MAPLAIMSRPETPMRRSLMPILLAALLAAAPAAAGPIPQGVWIVEDIDGRGVIDNLQSTLQAEGDRVAGMAGCNRYNGQLREDGTGLSIGPVMSTRMMCPPAVMDQEQKLFSALARVRGQTQRNGLLHLQDAEGRTIIRLSRKS